MDAIICGKSQASASGNTKNPPLPPNASALLFDSQPAMYVLQVLKHEYRSKPFLVGAGVFGLDDVFAKIKPFVARNLRPLPSSSGARGTRRRGGAEGGGGRQLPKLYFASVDIRHCYDTIDQVGMPKNGTGVWCRTSVVVLLGRMDVRSRSRHGREDLWVCREASSRQCNHGKCKTQPMSRPVIGRLQATRGPRLLSSVDLQGGQLCRPDDLKREFSLREGESESEWESESALPHES